MSKHALRCFNAQGMEQYEKTVSKIKNENRFLGSQLSSILEDPELTDIVVSEEVLEVRDFDTRFELAAHVDEAISKTKMSFQEVRGKTEIWNWLAALFFEKLIKFKDGRPTVGAKETFMAQTYKSNFWRYMRHKIAGPWVVFKIHENNNEIAEFILNTEPNTPGEMFEVFSQRIELIVNESILGAARLLYWDHDNGGYKENVLGKDPGQARRIPQIVNQLTLTYDLASMSPEKILELLPSEFDRFKNSK